MDHRDLIYRFKMARIDIQFIWVNVLIFILSVLFGKYGLGSVLAFSSENFVYKPWTFFTYSFYHTDFLHLASNMLILYFIGRIFMMYFHKKVFIKLYILGGISGAISFLLLHRNGLQGFFSGDSLLLGASASVMAIVVATAAYVPDFRLNFVLIGKVKLWRVALILVGVDVMAFFLGTGGGRYIAHLGGALIGYIYIKQLRKGIDIGKFIDIIISACIDGFNCKKEQKKFKTFRGSNTHGHKCDIQKRREGKMEAILKKISISGYDSLTKEEKDFMFNCNK